VIVAPNPPKDCNLCPRLVQFRADNIKNQPDWFNGAVPGFGDTAAELLIVGLAPGLGGANRTGRPFTGDWAGDLLYATLLKFGFATGIYDKRPDDGMELKNAFITNAVRCVPPANKPIGEEIRKCRPFLESQIATMANLKVIMTLGLVAHNATLTVLKARRAEYKFTHNATHQVTPQLQLIDSYHCSRYNTNTRRLTTEMFEDVFTNIQNRL
jgi:uracil-DNA glycosylase